ncbi:hypothetical protein ZYGR_0AS01430 [Zygosaccharomyces rouxii]|uniref:GPI inositol-deacylase n=1 Tax=Zygosaccharomyces rouxii TaxID=4956 RepID=A0A1Q3AGM9_ZYGRO|nr:hypothetical protein ZYGR_0AS01430 [Zygosaccharomyces rouxii]
MGVRRLLSSLARKGYSVSPLPLITSIFQDNSDSARRITRIGGYDQDEAKPEDYGADLALIDLNQQQTRNCRRRMTAISFIGLIFALVTAYLTLFGTFCGADSPKCHSVYMYPSYARIDGFDSNFTPLAKKYHLYLYREQGLDKEPMEDDSIQLDGIPILFIPGNAGSFKQVRSIAATCSELYFAGEGEIKNPHKRNLDFFAADFNEDFTAFHGRTMLDQAEYLNDAIKYILSLYEQNYSYEGPIPTSVIILGHSMGGVVARILPTLQNHVPYSIQSIITLSSPHATSPVTFDGDILKIYEQTNDFWRSQFRDRDSFMSKNVSLISLTGGILDSTLPADYTAVENIIPLENGFTLFSTGIPDVWTPIDHLAIVWCNQLREVIGKLLLETVSSNRKEKVLPLDERMAISRRFLLSGLEEYAFRDLNLADPQHHFKNYDSKDFEGAEVIELNEKFTVSSNNIDISARHAKFILPESDPTTVFYFLTSMSFTSMLFCKESETINEENGSTLECVDAEPNLLHIPASSEYTDSPGDSAMDGNSEPFKFLELDGRVFSHYDFVLLKSPNLADITNEDFTIAGVSSGINISVSNVTPLDVALHGFEIKLNSQFLWHEISFPNLWESLIAYELDVKMDYNEGDPIFQPFIRQWNHDPAETKWHVNVAHSRPNIFMHNVAPFVPLEETHDKALKLKVFQPPNSNLRLKMKINWKMTLQMLFLRYRLSFLALPISAVSIIMAYQFFWYNKTSNFMNFRDALSLILYKYWILITAVLLALSPIVNSRIVQKLLFALDPLGFNRPFLLEDIHMHANVYFLGIRNKYMLGLGLFFAIMTIGVLVFIFHLSQLLDQIIYRLKNIRVFSSKKADSYRPESQLLGLSRLVTSLLLILAVVFYIPYQLAAAICLVIQIGTYIRITFISASKKNREYLNLKNYNFCVFLLLAFVVAVDSPIIIVFLHNIAIRWETPFKSHHNFMAVAPMILLVGMNSRLNIPKYSKIDGIIIIGLLSYMGFFSLIYGTRNLYWTHHLCNITCAWLLYGMKLTKGKT